MSIAIDELLPAETEVVVYLPNVADQQRLHSIEKSLEILKEDARGLKSDIRQTTENLGKTSERVAKLEGIGEGEDRVSKRRAWVYRIVLGSSISLFLAYQGWLGHQIFTMNSRLASLGQGLLLARTMAQNEIKRVAELPQSEFNNSLPKVAAAMQEAALVAAQPATEEILPTLQAKLKAASDTNTGYWSAVSQFITYRSRLTSSATQIPIEGLPRCFDLKPQIQFLDSDRKPLPLIPFDEWSKGKPATARFFAGVVLMNCFVDLDDSRTSGKDFAGINWPGTEVGFAEFRQCLVRYSGGQVAEFTRKVVFRNCLFVVSINAPPPKRGEQITRLLVEARTLDEVTVPAG